MPWDPKEFASRHNKKLKGAAAAKGASIANAILRSGGDEGVAIATANKYANKMQRHRDKDYEHTEGSWGSLDGS